MPDGQFERIELFGSLKLSRIAKDMNTSNFIDTLVGNEFFQQWYLLSVDVEERRKWFDEFIECDKYEFE